MGIFASIFASKEQRAETKKRAENKKRTENEHTDKLFYEYRRTRREVEKLLRMEYIQDKASNVLNKLIDESKEAPNNPELKKKYEEARDIFNSVPYIELTENRPSKDKYKKLIDLSRELYPGEDRERLYIELKVDFMEKVNAEFDSFSHINFYANGKNWIHFRKKVADDAEFFLEFDNKINLDKYNDDIFSIFADMMKKSIGKSWIFELQEKANEEVWELLEKVLRAYFRKIILEKDDEMRRMELIYSTYKKQELSPLLEPTEPKNYVTRLDNLYSVSRHSTVEIEEQVDQKVKNVVTSSPPENPAVNKSSYSRMRSRKSKRKNCRRKSRKNRR